MILCIDSGNTRIKWGLRAGGAWLAQGALAQAEIGRLREALVLAEAPRRVMVANVAGEGAAAAIMAALEPWRESAVFVRSEAAAGGVVNGYDQPGRLGVDRWCALVGARRRNAAATLVVGAGTATTVDTLDAAGRFLGGLILPGFDLMRAALARNTAGLPLARGNHSPYPRCTEDAIFSGCLEAQAGAVERAWRRIADQAGAQCLIFGGAASLLVPHLDLPLRQVDTLVLDGLAALAGE